MALTPSRTSATNADTKATAPLSSRVRRNMSAPSCRDVLDARRRRPDDRGPGAGEWDDVDRRERHLDGELVTDLDDRATGDIREAGAAGHWSGFIDPLITACFDRGV